MKPKPSSTVGPEAERWLVRLQAADCDADERVRFQAWHDADPTHARAYRTAEHYWQQTQRLSQDADLRAIVEASRARRKRRQTFWSRLTDWSPQLTAVATMLVIAVGIGVFGFRSDWFAPAPVTYATAVGERRIVALEDGSSLTLNTDTAVEVRYRRNARQLTLTRGEAQFDVHRDPQRPFTVTAAGIAVTALGTRFQVHTEADATAITLLEGRVWVADMAGDANSARSTELVPGERLTVHAGQDQWQQTAIDPETAAVWTEGRLEFRAVPLSQAIEEINRYTTRKLRLADPSLEAIRLNGIFNTGDTETILGALEYTYPVQADRRSPHEIVLRARQ